MMALVAARGSPTRFQVLAGYGRNEVRKVVKGIMPKYEYKCRKCGRSFELILTMSEHARKGKAKTVKCPKCDSNQVYQLVSSIFVTTSKKS